MSDDEPRKYEKIHFIDNPDYHLGVELEAKFIQTPSGLDAWGHDVIFEFTGDDDFWLYVDGELVLDLGGIHSAVGGKVNFKTGKVEINGTQIGTLKSVFENNFITRYKASHNNANPSEDEINEYLDEYFGKDKNGEYENIFKDYTEHKMKIFYMDKNDVIENWTLRECYNKDYYMEDQGFRTLNDGTTEQVFYFYYVNGTDNGENSEMRVVESQNTTTELFNQLQLPILKKDYLGVFDQNYNIAIEAQAVTLNPSESPAVSVQKAKFN